MQKNNLDETQFMSKAEDKADKPKENTQSIPRIDDTRIMPREQAARKGAVRELKPIRTQRDGKEHLDKSRSKKKAILLVGGFVAALLTGFILAGYYHDHQQAAENQRLQQAAQLDQQTKSIQHQSQSLTEQKKQLEKEKRDLEEKQQALQAQAERMNGRNDQMTEDSKSSSAVSKILDKVTGKEKERQQAASDNAAKGAEASQQAASIGKSIDDAQAMINEVDSKLDDLNQMRQQAGKVKEAAESAYNEHAGTIEQALYYASQGVDFVRGFFSK